MKRLLTIVLLSITALLGGCNTETKNMGKERTIRVTRIWRVIVVIPMGVHCEYVDMENGHKCEGTCVFDGTAPKEYEVWQVVEKNSCIHFVKKIEEGGGNGK